MAKKISETPSLESLTKKLASARAQDNLAACHDAVDEIFDVLEKTNRNPGFEGGWEIWDMIERSYYYPDRIEDPDSLKTEQELLPVFAEMLRGPLDVFKFSVPLGERAFVCNPDRIGFQIGGTHGLALVPPATADDPISHLTGELRAATIGGATKKIERILDETLGMLRALGLVELAPAFLMPYVKLATVRLTNDKITGAAGEEFALSSEYATVLKAVRILVPRDLSELEIKSSDEQPVQATLARYFRMARRTLGSDSPRARELRNVCRIAFIAERTRDAGIAISLGFTCLEAILIGSKDGGDGAIGARLREAIAFSLGRTSDERQELRDEVKELYEVRSQFMHLGKPNRPTEGLRARVRTLDLAYRILKREFECLPVQSDAESTAEPGGC